MYLTSGRQAPVCSTYVNYPTFLRVFKWHIFYYNNLFPAISFPCYFFRCDLKYKVVMILNSTNKKLTRNNCLLPTQPFLQLFDSTMIRTFSER